MDPADRIPAGTLVPHCEVAGRALDPHAKVAPSGVARLVWTSADGADHAHGLHQWLRLDELLICGRRFRIEVQARREPNYDLPMFSAHKEFTFTGDTATVGEVAVGVGGPHGWVYGVVVVGARPDPEDTLEPVDTVAMPTVNAPGTLTGTPDNPAGWGVVPGGVPAHALHDLVTGAFPTQGNPT